MSTFYRRPSALGFAWIPMVAQVVGGALQSQPIEGQYIPPAPATSPALVAVAAVGGLAVIGGLLYMVAKG